METQKTLRVTEFDLGDEPFIEFKAEYEYTTEVELLQLLNDFLYKLNEVYIMAEIASDKFVWKEEYNNDESLFCTEVIAPLLRKMKYLSVKYSHGKKEYGKDFTFSELTPFGELRYYAMQVKAGNVEGGVNSKIDELIGQLQDSFSMPFYDLDSKEQKYISSFIIAISGKFTENAREKIIYKVPKHLLGNVYFWDKEKILEIIDRYWL